MAQTSKQSLCRPQPRVLSHPINSHPFSLHSYNQGNQSKRTASWALPGHTSISCARSLAASMPPPSEPEGMLISSAPKAAIALLRSSDMLAGMISFILKPRMAAAWARAMPVLPLVASIRVSPCLMRPLRSASLIMLSAGLQQQGQQHFCQVLQSRQCWHQGAGCVGVIV